jgi:hypothetical protein
MEQIAKPHGLADRDLWTILRLRLDTWPAWMRRLADALCAGSGRPMAVLALRLFALAVVVTGPVGSIPFAAGLSLLLLTQLHHFVRRGGVTTDTSDALNLSTLGAAWLGTVLGRDALSAKAGLWFVAALAVLSYFANGVAKLAAPSWRSGRAIIALLSTQTFGNRTLYRALAERPRWARMICWMMMLWECGFVLVVIVPDRFRMPLVISGILFHAFNAAIIGLNKFFWAFVATYPAIWWAIH